jgi:hypothetical protein
VLITALHHGLTEARSRRLIEALDVPAQTLWRWRRWWREQFLESRCWKALAGQLVPPIVTNSLPGSLLARLSGRALSDRLQGPAGPALKPDAQTRVLRSKLQQSVTIVSLDNNKR